jgi:hypothetical protein
MRVLGKFNFTLFLNLQTRNLRNAIYLVDLRILVYLLRKGRRWKTDSQVNGTENSDVEWYFFNFAVVSLTCPLTPWGSQPIV